jgi:hypothetical protein
VHCGLLSPKEIRRHRWRYRTETGEFKGLPASDHGLESNVPPGGLAADGECYKGQAHFQQRFLLNAKVRSAHAAMVCIPDGQALLIPR